VYAIFMKNLLKTYWGAWLLASLWCALQYAGGPILWDYARPAIAEGQYWRLLSAHFVQLNTAHLVLNLLGLLAVLGVWGEALCGARPLVLSIGMALGISLGLWFGTPHLLHYAGASGVLHGLFAAGIVLADKLGWRLRAFAALGLTAKLIAETQFNTGSADLIGAPVIHEAHQWGAFFGLLLAGAYAGFEHCRRR
jgi:rhomboid family GlyGly-CTERM serine protease